jgi:hypothetical protein
MTISKMIAGLMGPTLVAIGIASLLNLGWFPAMAEEIARESALIFLSGILLFVAGVAIVRIHNIWSGDWRVVVTLLGWLAIFGGLARMFFPARLASIAGQFGDMRALIVGSAVVLLLVGAFLSFKAYARE